MSGPINDISRDDILSVGQIFEQRYEILAVLGEGANGIVYKAMHVPMQKVVAIKMLLPHLVSNATTFLRFEQEARAASKLTHPNIIIIHDFGRSENGAAFLVMEFLGSVSLDTILTEDLRLDLDRFLKIFIQACDGLQHAHKHGIIHRDIKPSNMMLLDTEDEKDVLKIVDFGLAKVTAGAEQQNLTESNVLLGTPLFMSPEQCKGEPTDHRSDVYSLACVAYYSLTGSVPHMGATSISTICKRLVEPPPPFSSSAPGLDLSPDLERVILKALSRDPDDRQQSMTELREDMVSAMSRRGVAASARQKEKGAPGTAAAQAPTAPKRTPRKSVRAEALSRSKMPLAYICAGILSLTAVAATAIGFFAHPSSDLNMHSQTKSKQIDVPPARENPAILPPGRQASTDKAKPRAILVPPKEISKMPATQPLAKPTPAAVLKPASHAAPSQPRAIAVLPGSSARILTPHPIPRPLNHKEFVAQSKRLQALVEQGEDMYKLRKWDQATSVFTGVVSDNTNLTKRFGSSVLDEPRLFLVQARLISCLLQEQQDSFIFPFLKQNIAMLAQPGKQRKNIETEVGMMPDAAQIWLVMARASFKAAERPNVTADEGSNYLSWAQEFAAAALKTMGVDDPRYRNTLKFYCDIIEKANGPDEANRLRRQYHLIAQAPRPRNDAKNRPAHLRHGR